MAEVKPLKSGSNGDPAEFETGDQIPAEFIKTALSDLPAVCARRTTTQTAPTSFADLSFDSTVIENDDSVVEHNDTNNDRIDIKDTGLYLIMYALEYQPTGSPSAINARVRINDTTVVLQSELMIEEDNEETTLSTSFPAELTAGDFVSLQYFCSVGTETLQIGAVLSVVRMSGIKGDKGDTGSGSNVEIAEDGSNVANTPHSRINFKNCEATDAGSGTVDVTPIFGSHNDEDEKSTQQTTTNENTNGVNYHRFTTQNIPAGKYRIGWFYVWRFSSTGDEFMARVRVDSDNSLILTPEDWHQQEPKDSGSEQKFHTSGFGYVTFTSAGTHTIDLDFRRDGGGGTAFLFANRFEIWRVS